MNSHSFASPLKNVQRVQDVSHELRADPTHPAPLAELLHSIQGIPKLGEFFPEERPWWPFNHVEPGPDESSHTRMMWGDMI